jgi:hypothetical protein
VFSLRGTTRNFPTHAHLAHSWLEEDEEEEEESYSPNWVILDPTLKKKKKKFNLEISESSTLSLQGDVREYINTIYYGTLHIL